MLKFRQFLRDRRANVLPIFAIALLPLIIATGAVIDYARAYQQRTTVQDAMDAASLAAGKKLGIDTDTNVKTEATNFYNSNIGTNKVTLKPTITPVISGATITITSTLHVPTYFLGLIGLNEFVFNLTSQSTQAAGTMEVAMVLDNSTSMNLPSSKISTLRTAAASLATTLWNLGTTSTKPDPIKIAVVPFGASVNVGTGATSWIDTTGVGTYAADAMKDTTLLGSGNAASTFNPYSIFSTLKDSSGTAVSWAGCTESRPSPYDVSDDAPYTGTSPSSEQAKTMFEPLIALDDPDDWNCGTSSCDYLGSSSKRSWNGTPTGNQTFNNYLPDAGDATTCGTDVQNVTISNATPAKFTKSSHGLAAGTPLMLSTTNTLPSGLSTTATYYVSPAGLASGFFYVATTTTGTNITAVGPKSTALTSISNAKPAVLALNSHGLAIGDDITLVTTGSLPSGLATGTTYYVASTTTNNFTLTAASAATTATISKASPGVLTTSANHGLAIGDAVVLKTTNTLPSPLAVNTIYYVKTVPTSKTFTVASTSSGTAINTTTNGSGTHSFVKLVATTSAGSGTHSYQIPGDPTIFTSAGHGLSNGDAVAISTTGSLPTPVSASTIYYVVGSTTNYFSLATTSGGTGITVTGTYTGTLKFIKLVATSSAGSGTHTYYTNPTSYTCDDGTCSSGYSGIKEKAAFGGKSVAGKDLCKYGTSTNKATMANITVANLSGTGKGGPNFMCTTTAITPLTTTHQTVSDAITAMQANGYTNITEGLMWGWRVLSPGAPFTDGRAYGTSDNAKIIVLMTDGENTYNPYLQADTNPGSSTYAGTFLKSSYGAWGYIAENHLGTTSTTSQDVFDKLNAKTAAACTAAKAAGIRIYTVGFEINSSTSSDPEAALDLLENCATATSMYFDAQDEDALEDAFSAIGDDLSQLRLSQ